MAPAPPRSWLSRFARLELSVFIVVLGAQNLASAQRDYDPRSRAWNGLSQLSEIAAESGITLRTPDELDLSRLSPDDAILIVYPTEELPSGPLGAFMRAGGRIAIADDFGESDAMLGSYGIHRHGPRAPTAPRLRGNPNLPVARTHPRLNHPLTSGISAVVANHPSVLRHPELEPLVSLTEGQPLVLVGAVGQGRLVAVGDSSILINNMLQFRGNRAFAANLLHYLAASGRGQLWLVAGDTPVTGHFGDPLDPLAKVRKWLAGFASTDVPPLALMLGSLLLVTLFVLIAASSLPRRSPYDGAAMLPPEGPAGGYVGRVEFFLKRPSHLFHPLMVYKFELEGELVRRLGLTGRPLLGDVLEKLRLRGLSEPALNELRRLLSELDELREHQDRPPGPPRIGERRFRSMVETGERILGALDRQGTA